MAVATSNTVLGDFSDSTFDYYSSSTRFLTVDGKYVVRTEDATGDVRDFEVTHTFGVEPLQQYLVEFPGGRKQALPFIWDTRSAENGGQRWFHLYPDEYIEPGDELHWTGPNFNWNFTCAECHSTDLQMGYDATTDSFNTTWSEISVGCEACHGPGSEHLRQAADNNFDDQYGLLLSLDDQEDAAWLMNLETGISERSKVREHPQHQPEACGRCHSRRSVVAPEYEYGQALTATHMPALLDDGLYFADGQIQDEVYVYGSFLQSRMYQAGVTCSDCHNPHSGALKTGPDSNNVCAQCHLPGKFATAEHQGPDDDDLQCVDCHMKSRVYMGNDARRDHNFRKPDGDAHRTEAFARSRSNRVNDDLVTIANDVNYAGIVRASALTRLSQPYDDDAAQAIRESLNDPDPLLRIGALRALRQLPPQFRLSEGTRLLGDPVRGVRLEAAETYAELSDLFEINDNRAFQRAAKELRQTYLHNGSRAESHAQLGNFEMMLRNDTQAIRHYEKALAINPGFLPGYLNLADLVRRSGDDIRAESLLREGLRRSPDTAALHHSLGLSLVRSGNSDEALQSLRKAVDLDAESPRYAYVLAVALNSLGQSEAALTLLTESRQEFTDDYDIGWALATMLRDAGDIPSARQVAEELERDYPADENVKALAASLR